jgi:hypothetical protein
MPSNPSKSYNSVDMQLGFSESWLLRLFNNIPSDLMDAMINCVVATATVAMQAQNAAELRNAGKEEYAPASRGRHR